jgi:hypothetical protein
VRVLLAVSVLMAGCSTSSQAPLPKQPDAPTSENIVATVGKEWDKADQKVAASVTIARENADKPEVVRGETTVALSFLPAPAQEELALARQRAAKADQKDYAQAVEFGKKLLAKIDVDWAKVQADSAEAKRVSGLKDARIKELTAEVEQTKKDAAKNIWTITGAALAVIGAVATAFTGPKIGIPLILCGAFCGAVPFIIDSEYFSYIAGTTLTACAGLGIWFVWDKVRDSNKESDYEPPKI